MDIDSNESSGPAKAAYAKAPEHWPKGVGPISFNGLSRIGVDDHNNLYWDGKRVQTVAKLGIVERILATAVAVGTVSMAVVDILRFLKGA